MKIPVILFVASLLLALCWACDDDNPTKPKDPDPVIGDFPNNIGLSWTYEVTDSNPTANPELTVDTVVVNIADTITLYGETAGVWAYDYRNGTDDTMRVVGIGDTIFVFRNTGVLYASYVFPLQVGRKWLEDQPYVDSTRIDSVATLTTPAGEFADAYRVVKSWNVADNAGEIKTWIVAGKGIVQQDNYLISFAGLRYSRWRLLSLSDELR